MFTGIIETKTEILSRDQGRFTLRNPFPEELKLGQSIAHDGACMTVESFNDNVYTIFMMEESLQKTHFSEKKIGDSLNLERCLKVDDRIDGHFVSGHIDCVGEVSLVEKKPDGSLIVGVSFAKDKSLYTIEKGSIALNGASLTIVEKQEGYISVSLIPLTQDWTNLGTLRIGDKVNIEFDILGKYILNK
ncbi:riboflavin synthase [Candidatus Gracilibacteria bacterium]|nr:riboflavin synthase [Candidatus Gracilibacteria bacterium]